MNRDPLLPGDDTRQIPKYSLYQAFHLYNEKADQEDLDFYTECNGSMDSLLVFSGLFSAVTTALIVETYKDLKPEPQVHTDRLLAAILTRLGNSSAPTQMPEISFSPSKVAIATNILLFISLCQWARNFYNGVRHISSARKRARARYERVQGKMKWKLLPLISWVPMMLHISLFVFFAGLSLWLWTLNLATFIFTVAVTGGGLLTYLLGAAIPVVDSNAPFRWPLSDVIQTLAALSKLQRTRSTIDIEANQTELAKLASPIFPTPIQASEAAIIDAGAVSLDETDALVVTNLLEYSDTISEIEASFNQLREIVTQSSSAVRQITPEMATMFLRKAVELASSCRDPSGSMFDLRNMANFYRATTVLHFVEIIMQLESLNKEDETLRDSVQLLGKLARLYFNESMQHKVYQRITLGASTLCRIIVFTNDKEAANQHLLKVSDVFETLAPMGPRRPGTAPTRYGWTVWDFKVFQGMVTAYILAFTQVVEMADQMDITLSEEQYAALLQGSDRLIRTTWCLQIDKNSNFIAIVDDLERRWLALLANKVDSLIGRWIQIMAAALHRDATIEDGKRVFRWSTKERLF
ncbi:hypothetical protein FRC17_010090 [Serendipita sp. 399]|nr:hypothetical protein FRC17_010090 [Serendipita sp. 399]